MRVLMMVVLVALAPADSAEKRASVAREWHGKVSSARADEYDAYLRAAITRFTSIKGNLGYQMMREADGEVTHFAVISYWESRDAIRAYAGDDIRKVRALPRDPEFLIDPEPTVRNYELAVDARR